MQSGVIQFQCQIFVVTWPLVNLHYESLFEVNLNIKQKCVTIKYF